MKLVLEIGFKLDKPLKYYQQILKNAGAINVYNCETIDLYWTNKKLENMTENEMKNACIRFRMCRNLDSNSNFNCTFQNYNIFSSDKADFFVSSLKELNKIEDVFYKKGYKKVFETSKKDYQYSIGNMKSRIQLQQIDNIGLILYYDNPDYYEQPLQEQRKNLIDELNSYGFNFSYEQLGLDKLRTLYYQKEMYSENRND